MVRRYLYIIIALLIGISVGLLFALQNNGQDFVFEGGERQNLQEQEPEHRPLTILFGGDIFLDRSIRRSAQANGIDFIWSEIEGFLKNYDHKIANLEGPVWATASPAPSGSFTFAFQPEYVDKLKDLGFSALSLANNHTLNQGKRGLDNSRQYLENLGIIPFGDPSNEAEYCCAEFNRGEEKIMLVGEHDLITSGQQDVLKKITEAKQSGYFVVVLPHWGPEYVLNIPAIEQNRAHALIDAGADLIIGAHPHVIQPIEIYKGKVIFYSLGNFLFDQYFSEDTMQGLLVEAEFKKKSLKFTLHPTQQQSRTYQIQMASEEAKKKLFKRLYDTSIAPEEIKQGILKGEFEISR